MSGEMTTSFFVQLADGFFTQYGKPLSSLLLNQTTPIPFKDNPQFAIIVDILSRKESHHTLLNLELMPNFKIYFLEALLQHLAHDHIPPHLRETELFYFDMAQAELPKFKAKTIEKDFDVMREFLNHTEKYLLFAFPAQILINNHPDNSDEGLLRNQFLGLATHPKCRILLLNYANDALKPLPGFIPVNIPDLNDSEVMTILKLQRVDLEHFHNIIIPEDLLGHAYSLADRFLSTSNTLEQALLLLDSSAARTITSEQAEMSSQFKPVLTHTILTSVLSTWTQIPVSHLHTHKYKIAEFTQNMQQKIYGQDAAIAIMAKELQHLQSTLEHSNKPLASFIFAGPKNTGKDVMAAALADQLYKQPNVLYFSQLGSQTLTSIANLKIKRVSDKHYSPLKDVINNAPHAMIVIDDFDTLSPAVLDELVEITSTGYLNDIHSTKLNFRHATILLYTSYGTNRLIELTLGDDEEDDNADGGSNLLQLLMNEQRHKPSSRHEYTPEEFVDALLPELSTLLPPALIQHTQIVPFLPLNKIAIEKIAHLKLKQLGKTLEMRYGIEFGFAPEVVRYLVNEVLYNQALDQHNLDIEATLKPLYATIEQAILSQADNKNRPNQLFLQLNETGQLLRCDWLAVSALRA